MISLIWTGWAINKNENVNSFTVYITLCEKGLVNKYWGGGKGAGPEHMENNSWNNAAHLFLLEISFLMSNTPPPLPNGHQDFMYISSSLASRHTIHFLPESVNCNFLYYIKFCTWICMSHACTSTAEVSHSCIKMWEHSINDLPLLPYKVEIFTYWIEIIHWIIWFSLWTKINKP